MQITDNSATQSTNADFHGAAIVDQNGQEVPITEDMIQVACNNLDACESES